MSLPIGHDEKLEALYNAAAEIHGVPVDDVTGNRRTPEAVAARHDVWWIAHHQLDLAYNRIAKLVDVDHTTIMSAVRHTPDPDRIARILVRSILTRTQQAALVVLADGKARISNRTDVARRLVASKTARSLERYGLAWHLEYVAVATDAGKTAAADVDDVAQVVGDADYEHGTQACYVLDGCRCFPCKVAATAAERDRARQEAYGRPKSVDATPVRRHVRKLQKQGMGLKRIAKLSGVSVSAIGKLMYGVPSEGRPKSRTVRATTAERILATELDLADGACIDGSETFALVDELVDGGFTKAELGRLVHDEHSNALQLGGEGGNVTAGNAARVAELHRLWLDGKLLPAGRQGRTKAVSIVADARACEDCGEPSLANGRWCLRCFYEHSSTGGVPSKAEQDEAHRRDQWRLRKRRERQAS